MVNIPFIGKRVLDPKKMADKLLMKQHGLTKAERLDMFLRKLALTQIAIPIGSAIYWLLTQIHYLHQYVQPNGKLGSLVNVNLKKPWDNFPYYFDNMIHYPLFAPLVHNAAKATAPMWWVGDRHNYRHVLIGFLAYVFIGAFAIAAIKVKKRASTPYMVMSFPVAFIVAIVVSTASLFLLNKYAPAITSYGVGSGVPLISDITAAGAWEPTLIGVLAGIAAQLILKPTFATMQLSSIERNISQGDNVHRGLRRIIYTAAYKHRFDLLVAEGNKGRLGRKWIGPVLFFVLLAGVILLGIGGWLNYGGGPATLVH